MSVKKVSIHNKDKEKSKPERFGIRILIGVLGAFLLFGLGFVLGLNYAQNIYLTPQEKTNKLWKESYMAIENKDYQFYKTLNEHDENRKKLPISSPEAAKKEKPFSPLKIKKNSEDAPSGDLGQDNKYTIQVYSYRSLEVASKIVNELKNKGYMAYQSETSLTNGERFYRVRIGRFATKTEAIKTLDVVCKMENKNAYITTDP